MHAFDCISNNTVRLCAAMDSEHGQEDVQQTAWPRVEQAEWTGNAGLL